MFAQPVITHTTFASMKTQTLYMAVLTRTAAAMMLSHRHFMRFGIRGNRYYDGSSSAEPKIAIQWMDIMSFVFIVSCDVWEKTAERVVGLMPGTDELIHGWRLYDGALYIQYYMWTLLECAVPTAGFRAALIAQGVHTHFMEVSTICFWGYFLWIETFSE